MDFQPLFDEKVLEVRELSPGYEDHTNDVWLVTTEKDEFVVRSPRMGKGAEKEFWRGCRYTFGIGPGDLDALENLSVMLAGKSILKIPRVIRRGVAGQRRLAVVEKLDGGMVETFVGQPSHLLASLGAGMAQIHLNAMDYAGNPAGSFRVQLKNFHRHLVDVMGRMIREFYRADRKIVTAFPQVAEALCQLAAPASATYVLVDLDPTQFVSDGIGITGLVDTEAYAIGPRELDFIALEYVLDQKSADDFREGYEKVLLVPDLAQCRLPYRYLYRLLEIQEPEELDKWLSYPILFA